MHRKDCHRRLGRDRGFRFYRQELEDEEVQPVLLPGVSRPRISNAWAKRPVCRRLLEWNQQCDVGAGKVVGGAVLAGYLRM